MLGFGFVSGFGFRVSSFGFRVSGFGLRENQDLGEDLAELSGFVLRVSGIGYQIGVGLWV